MKRLSDKSCSGLDIKNHRVGDWTLVKPATDYARDRTFCFDCGQEFQRYHSLAELIKKVNEKISVVIGPNVDLNIDITIK